MSTSQVNQQSTAEVNPSQVRKILEYILPPVLVVLLALPVGIVSKIGTREIITLSLFLIGQNVAFTLVSRARQTANLKFHALAAIGSNGFYIFVLTTVVAHYQNNWMKVWYIVCTVVGSVHAHYLSLHKFEKSKMFKNDAMISRKELDLAITGLEERITQLIVTKPQ
jgi:hypothetical protein